MLANHPQYVNQLKNFKEESHHEGNQLTLVDVK